jgi:Protein of unknown function (DUF3089)
MQRRQWEQAMARKFLYIIAGMMTLAVIVGIGYRLFEPQIWQLSFIPNVRFADSKPVPAPDYTKLSGWIAHPNMANNPALDTPEGYQAAPRPGVDVFYVAPTTYFKKVQWNAPLNDAESLDMQRQMVRHQATAFNGVGRIWAPNYRQATFGSFFTRTALEQADAKAALGLAYSDVENAFAAFQVARDAKRPFILLGHSQGSLHLLQLLKNKIVGSPARDQLVAAYIIGWPISEEADLAPMGFSMCQSPNSTGCVIGWQSYGATSDLKKADAEMQFAPTLSGKPRKGTQNVCVNPLGFWANQKPMAKDLNQGALAFGPNNKALVKLTPELTGAMCAGQGYLQLTPSPGDPWRERLMPDDNYHTYDINLFWANIRNNAEARVQTFMMPK